MRTQIRIFTLLGLVAALLGGASGCKDKGQPVECHQACQKLQYCSEGELNVDYCDDRCADDREEQQPLYSELQRCTDCLDATYNCSEVASKCPLCVDVQAELIAAQPAENAGGAGGAGG